MYLIGSAGQSTSRDIRASADWAKTSYRSGAARSRIIAELLLSRPEGWALALRNRYSDHALTGNFSDR